MNRVKIIYEDEFIIVADKPAGVLTVPTPKKEGHTLESILKAYPAHRLDRDTSGLIILAKNRQIRRRLIEEFKNHKVKKTYIAFVHGAIKSKSGVIKRAVRDNPFEAPKFARTEYKLLEAGRDFSALEVYPITGRTNQIRIHFKQIGHPLVGERRFAFARDFQIKFRRHALHSAGLEFFHPVSGKKMSFVLDMPQDMKDFLKRHQQ